MAGIHAGLAWPLSMLLNQVPQGGGISSQKDRLLREMLVLTHGSNPAFAEKAKKLLDTRGSGRKLPLRKPPRGGCF